MDEPNARADYKTNARRGCLAILFAGVSATILVVAYTTVLTWIAAGFGGVASEWPGWGGAALLMTLSFVAAWTCIFILVAPVWSLLHALGFRGPRAAILIGTALALLAEVVDTLAIAPIMHRHGAVIAPLPSILIRSIPIAAMGALVGIATWRVAYRRALDSANSDAPSAAP
jgi:hypothetical protein